MAKKGDNAYRLIQLVDDYPVSLYRLPTDGPKWKSICKDCALLVGKLARWGDNDGTSIYPSITNTIAPKLAHVMSLRTIWRLMGRLEKHGVLINDPRYHGEEGPRVRRLDVRVLEFWYPAKGFPQVPGRPDGLPGKNGKAGVPNSKAGVPNGTDETGQECQMASSGVPNGKAGVPNLGGTQPPALPPVTAPTPTATTRPSGQAGAVVSDLQKAYQQIVGKVLAVTGKSKLSAMVSPYSPATVARAVEQWARERTMPVETLRNAASALLTELPDLLAANTEAQLEAKAAEHKRAVEYVPTPAEIEADHLRIAQQAGCETWEEYKAEFDKLTQDIKYETNGEAIMAALGLPAQGE